jgi:hypothetical protein
MNLHPIQARRLISACNSTLSLRCIRNSSTSAYPAFHTQRSRFSIGWTERWYIQERLARKHGCPPQSAILYPSRRAFHDSRSLRHAELTPPKPGEELHVTFVTKEGEEFTYEVAEGDNLLDIAQANDLEMEGIVLSLEERVSQQGRGQNADARWDC